MGTEAQALSGCRLARRKTLGCQVPEVYNHPQGEQDHFQINGKIVFGW